MNAIEARELSKQFGKTMAVRELSFVVPEGSICGLAGPNGAGKSTTLRLLMNLVQPTRGSATVLGIHSARLTWRERQRIGYVAEGEELPGNLTVGEFLDFMRPLYPAWDSEFEGRLLRHFELPLDSRLCSLSRGMRMKASLLSTLAFRPRLLLLDEPFSGLDPVIREEVVTGLLDLAGSEGTTVLISSHDIEEIERIAEHLLILADGSLRLATDVASLLASVRRVSVFSPTQLAVADPPRSWLNLKVEDLRAEFVDTQHDESSSLATYCAAFPGADVQIQPMTLREIYVSLAIAWSH